jgi:hypothetical protein
MGELGLIEVIASLVGVLPVFGGFEPVKAIVLN